jgi:hypothetical protein
MEDGVSSICIDGLNVEQIRRKIEDFSNENERYGQMCHRIYELAKENCNFDEEEIKIRKFLTNLV